MLDALAPRHLGNVDQAVDVVLDLDEHAKLGHVPDLALDARADWVLLSQLVPGVALDLLESERKPPRRRIDTGHLRFDGVANLEDLRRVFDALAPRHLAHVDQAFD